MPEILLVAVVAIWLYAIYRVFTDTD